jgi:hypothetical protein
MLLFDYNKIYFYDVVYTLHFTFSYNNNFKYEKICMK